jgi:tetratricopeptide (TPR) repeat protein
VYRARSAIHEKKGDLVGAIELAEQARDRSGGDRAELARSVGHLANLHRVQGKLDEALRLGRRAEEMYRDLDMPADEALIHGIVGVCLHRKGDMRGALEAYTRSLELRETCGDLEGAANTLNNLGALYGLLDRPDEAVRQLDRCLAYTIRAGHREHVPELHALRANAHQKAGDLQAARKDLEDGARCAEEAGNAELAAKLRAKVGAL